MPRGRQSAKKKEKEKEKKKKKKKGQVHLESIYMNGKSYRMAVDRRRFESRVLDHGTVYR